MASLLILLSTLFIIATMRSANARFREGDYTEDEEIIFQGIDEDKSIHQGRVANNIFLLIHRKRFRDICNEGSKDEKLSICLKVLQHKWNEMKPTILTIDPNESSCECQPTKFIGRNGAILYQRMYLCPETTITTPNTDNSETQHNVEPFFIGQGLHRTQYRIRSFERDPEGGAAKIQAQLTGFKLNVASFGFDLRRYIVHWPQDDGVQPQWLCEVQNFRRRGKMDDYLVQWESEPAQ